MAGKKNKIRIVPIFISVVTIILVVAVAAFVATSKRNKPIVEEVQTVVQVDTITPETGSISIDGEYIGTIEPNKQITVYPKIAGEVETVNFSVGDTVEAGDVLFTINATDIQNNIKSLQAQLSTQDAMVRAAQTGVSLANGSAMQSQALSASGGVQQAESAVSQAEQNVEQALIAIDQAQLAYDTALKSYNDTNTLFQAGAISRVQFEQAETAHTNALSSLERAQSSYNIAEISLSQAQQALAQARESKQIVTEQTPTENNRRAQDALEQAQTARSAIAVNLQTAREKLNDAAVEAPISGVIEIRSIEPFNMASPQSPAFVITDKNSMQVVFNVPSSTVRNLKIGDSAVVKMGGEAYDGKISEIGISVNSAGLFPVKVQFDGNEADFMTGLTVTVTVNTQQTQGAIILPLKYVYFKNNEAYVYAVESGKAVVKPVELGLMTDETVELLSGVDTKTQIISTWSPDLKDGVQVEARQGE